MTHITLEQAHDLAMQLPDGLTEAGKIHVLCNAAIEWHITEAAPAAQKVEQFDWTPVAAWWESGNEDFGNLKDAIRKMLAMLAAPAAQESVGWVMDDVGTVAWHKDVPVEGTDLFICTQRNGV